MDPTHEPQTAPGDPPVETQPASSEPTPTNPETENGDADDPQPNRGGAPVGNANAATHGLRMTTGELPGGCAYITRQLRSFKTALENAVLDARGVLGVYELAAVQSAVEWHSHALKARRWARVADNDLEWSEKLAFSRESARAFDQRDAILKRLGLDRPSESDAIVLLYERTEGADDDGHDSE
jgi:hypothetical protein